MLFLTIDVKNVNIQNLKSPHRNQTNGNSKNLKYKINKAGKWRRER